VRLIVAITLFVLGVGILLCQWEGMAALPPAAVREARWVRTVDGWERVESWHTSVVARPRLQPVVVAAAQGLFSVFALAAFPTGALRKSR
jgi:hypothetical protein